MIAANGKKIIECFGGPLDGRYVEQAEGAFPCPYGWYYMRYMNGESPLLRTLDLPLAYKWDGEPGRYLDEDHERWQRTIRLVYE